MTPNEGQQILERLARMEVKLDDHGEELKEVKELATTTNGRVTALEKNRERDKGFVAALALLMPIATAVISALIVNAI
jgi:hypothetical protein